MRKTAVNFEAVRALGRDFPDLQESTMYGSPALKLGKRLVACLAIHRSAEPGSLVLRTDFEQRDALITDDPGTCYVTDHYVKHPVVLVRLARVQHDQLTFSPQPDSAFSLTPSGRTRRPGCEGYKDHSTRG